MTPVRTELGAQVLREMQPLVARLLNDLNELPLVVEGYAPSCLEEVLGRGRAACQHDDERDDLFVLGVVSDFLGSYQSFWQQVLAGNFETGWRRLQDCLDDVRAIKRFSALRMEAFEHQLLELEKCFPYKIFASMGVCVERYDCSICGQDIDSDSCTHRMGHLYGGQLARGVAHNIIDIDHISLVKHPKDKRCVIRYDEDSSAFQLIRYVAQLVTDGRMRVLDFRELRPAKLTRPNADYRRLGRNAPCFCDSGRKFKHCCIERQYLEVDHVDVIGTPRASYDVFSLHSISG